MVVLMKSAQLCSNHSFFFTQGMLLYCTVNVVCVFYCNFPSAFLLDVRLRLRKHNKHFVASCFPLTEFENSIIEIRVTQILKLTILQYKHRIHSKLKLCHIHKSKERSLASLQTGTCMWMVGIGMVVVSMIHERPEQRMAKPGHGPVVFLEG